MQPFGEVPGPDVREPHGLDGLGGLLRDDCRDVRRPWSGERVAAELRLGEGSSMHPEFASNDGTAGLGQGRRENGDTEGSRGADVEDLGADVATEGGVDLLVAQRQAGPAHRAERARDGTARRSPGDVAALGVEDDHVGVFIPAPGMTPRQQHEDLRTEYPQRQAGVEGTGEVVSEDRADRH